MILIKLPWAFSIDFIGEHDQYSEISVVKSAINIGIIWKSLFIWYESHAISRNKESLIKAG